jgi:hypothetical protein
MFYKMQARKSLSYADLQKPGVAVAACRAVDEKLVL